MPITLDAERAWKVQCDATDCGWRTYVSAPHLDAALGQAMRKYGVTLAANGSLRCAKHRPSTPASTGLGP